MRTINVLKIQTLPRFSGLCSKSNSLPKLIFILEMSREGKVCTDVGRGS
jgi:hypothetical protein